MNKEKFKLATNIGKTVRLMDEGLTPSEIAENLKQPESSVREWIAIIDAIRHYDNVRL